MKKLISILFLVICFKANSQINLATTLRQDSIIKQLKLLVAQGSGTSSVSSVSVVNSPSVTVLNPSVTITGTAIATQSLQTQGINTLTIVKTLLDSVKYYTQLSAYGANNVLGGYFYASTLQAITQTVAVQIGPTIPNGYRLCITNISFNNTNTLATVPSFTINSGAGNNPKFIFAPYRSVSTQPYNEVSKMWDCKNPLMLDTSQSLYIISGSTVVGTWNLVVIGYISKI